MRGIEVKTARRKKRATTLEPDRERRATGAPPWSVQTATCARIRRARTETIQVRSDAFLGTRRCLRVQRDPYDEFRARLVPHDRELGTSLLHQGLDQPHAETLGLPRIEAVR